MSSQRTRRGAKGASPKRLNSARLGQKWSRSWRYWSMSLLVCALGAGLLVRIASLQVMPDVEKGYEFLQYQGELRTIREQQIPAYRGTITDRNGAPLAISTPLVSLWLNPSVADPRQFPKLAALLDMDRPELEKKINRYTNRQFMYVRRGFSPAEADRILSEGIQGLYGETHYRRFYPEAEVVAQVVGLTNIDDQGIEGVELGYDQILSGSPGAERVVKDLKGRIVDHLGVVRTVQPGSDIQLTIDLRLQYLAYRALKAAVTKHRAEAASMVIMDPHSGEVLAMVSQPSVNPNARDSLSPLSMRNRAIVDSFEPGSTIKPFTLMAAMEQGLVSPETRIDTSPGYIRVSGKLIEDPRNYGELDVRTILAKSSQVGTVKVAMNMEPERIHDMFQRVGLGTPLGVGFPGELSGVLPYRSRWDDIQRATFAFGYGLTATSLQLAQAYSVIANGGSRRTPSLVIGTVSPSHEAVVDARLTHQIRSMMVDVVDRGTGTRARVDGYKVAGKTGTGHLVGARGYEDSRYASLFAGMVPADAPELVAVVVVTDPKAGEYHGGAVAAPVFAEVMGEAMRLLRVAPLNTESRVASR